MSLLEKRTREEAKERLLRIRKQFDQAKRKIEVQINNLVRLRKELNNGKDFTQSDIDDIDTVYSEAISDLSDFTSRSISDLL